MLATESSTPLVLFSGLAADAEVFAPQKLAFPQLVVPAWKTPLRGESLDAYCDRMADQLRPYGHVILGGASFGGIVALHVARRLQPAAVVLIGSARTPTALPAITRLRGVLGPCLPYVPVGLLKVCSIPFATRWCRRRWPGVGGLATQFRRADPAVFRWSLLQILTWTEPVEPGCPVFQIHGARDRLLSTRGATPDVIIPNAGHIISLTHSREVNQFLAGVLQRLRN